MSKPTERPSLVWPDLKFEQAISTLSVIVLTHNTRELLRECLNSLRSTEIEIDLEIWVVDNASVDGTIELIRQDYPHVNLIANDRNLGFPAGNNLALARCRGRYALLLNSDTVVRPGALERMVSFMNENPEAGMVGCRLVNASGAIEASASGLPRLQMQVMSFFELKALVPARLIRALVSSPLARATEALTSGYFTAEEPGTEPREVAFLSGACIMVRRETWEEIGLLDERIFLYLEDADWCRRAGAAGWKLYYLPGCTIVHLGGRTFMRRSGGRSYRISTERVASLIYYFQKYESRTKVILLRSVIATSMAVRLASHLLRNRNSNVNSQTYWRIFRMSLGR
jgi:GT2 family glycosyltransferase